MTDNVIHAFGASPPSERKEAIIAILTEALELARTNPVTGIAVVFVGDGFTQSNHTCDHWTELLGGLQRAIHNLNKDIDNGR